MIDTWQKSLDKHVSKALKYATLNSNLDFFKVFLIKIQTASMKDIFA